MTEETFNHYCDDNIRAKTKPLSDEEIKNLHEQTSWWGISDPVKFARAIEERHGIK